MASIILAAHLFFTTLINYLMQIPPRKTLDSLLIWYSLAVTATIVFLYGYFPLSNNQSNTVVNPPKNINNVTINVSSIYQAQVDKVIFIVIDALRKDFVNEEYMPYLNSHIRDEKGCLLDVKVEPPTVTMPRIKAITTGTVPQFIDIILNFANSELQEDSLLHRAKEVGKNIVFYGDDTWIKLYPNMFLRSEGTTSFYVTDYVEVDNNVTRHLPKELKRKDWDLLVLHYLGLDHIGHIYGPYHYLIKIKLREMDEIIQNIAVAIQTENRRTMIAICGDHGMRDSGGHGGSSAEETIVPLAVLGLSCKHNTSKKTIAQIDIAPTIAALMSLALPADNVGRIRSDFMHCSKERLLYMFHYNALNLIKKNSNLIHLFQDVFNQHAKVLTDVNVNSLNNIMILYENTLQEASEMLMKVSGSQQTLLLYLSSSILIIICVAILEQRELFQCYSFLLVIATSILVVLNVCDSEQKLVTISTFVICLASIIIVLFELPNLSAKFLKLNLNSFCFILFGGLLSQIILLASSSFIEEEHQIWFFFWNTFVTFAIFKELQTTTARRNIFSWFAILAVFRILRHLNHIGNISSVPDISDYLLQQQNWFWLHSLFVTGLIAINYFCTQLSKDILISLLSSFTVLCIFWYRMYLNYYPTVIPAIIAKIFILVIFAIRTWKQRNIFKTLTISWILWITLLMRPQNIILIPICIILSKKLRTLVTRKTFNLEHLWLATVLYHCQGTYNNLASIDISSGYVGISYYSPIITTFQIICQTYAFHTLCVLLLLSNTEQNNQFNFLRTIGIHRTLNITYICIIALINRQHLFVWSVFSPKLLIEVCHTLYVLFCLLLYKIILMYHQLIRKNKNFKI